MVKKYFVLTNYWTSSSFDNSKIVVHCVFASADAGSEVTLPSLVRTRLTDAHLADSMIRWLISSFKAAPLATQGVKQRASTKCSATSRLDAIRSNASNEASQLANKPSTRALSPSALQPHLQLPSNIEQHDEQAAANRSTTIPPTRMVQRSVS